MEALDTAVAYWEDALAAYTSEHGGALALPSADEADFTKELQQLLDLAYSLQNASETMFLDQVHIIICRFFHIVMWTKLLFL